MLTNPRRKGIGQVRTRDSGPEQLPGQGPEFRPVPTAGFAPAVEDGLELGQGAVEVPVHDHVIEIRPVRHLERRFPETARDRLVAVAAALAQPRLELGA